ncbi:MAG: acetyl/propionyl/methylcrotonyl-CoA carboxylase subunit alpha [Anaerolineae bacterium]
MAETPTLFRKVLVANRGEIAVRVIRACRELGLQTVAVYSDADRNAMHVRYATEAYHIGPSIPAQSYLVMDKILDVALKTGADAIHPGYGFLSERAAFARACADEGIAFIGPNADSIEKMGDKITARYTMQSAGVPVVPGTDSKDVLSDEDLRAAAEQVTFPLLIKAPAGGGGKGMRRGHSMDEFDGALASARREATAAFGDGNVYLEKLIEGARHIEIQVLGDMHGSVIHLGERECSIQRRHQKLLEECPSPFVDEQLRAQMGAMAVRAAEAVNYVNAGTVECLVDKDKNFYFLEMNTRLQVEHPVTEMVTNMDIVK